MRIQLMTAAAVVLLSAAGTTAQTRPTALVGTWKSVPDESKLTSDFDKSVWGANATSVAHTTRMFAFRYRSAEHFVDVFRTFYGPTHKAFGALDATGQAALEADMLALLRAHDRGGAAGLVVPAEYLETVIVR